MFKVANGIAVLSILTLAACGCLTVALANPICDDTVPKSIPCANGSDLPTCTSYPDEKSCKGSRWTKKYTNDFTYTTVVHSAKRADPSTTEYDCWCEADCVWLTGGCSFSQTCLAGTLRTAPIYQNVTCDAIE